MITNPPVSSLGSAIHAADELILALAKDENCETATVFTAIVLRRNLADISRRIESLEKTAAEYMREKDAFLYRK